MRTDGVRLRSVGALVAASVIWGLTFVYAKSVLDHFAAVQAAFLRLVFALPLLVPLACARGVVRAPLRLTAPLAATGMAGYFAFTHLGLERATVSTGAFVQALAPILTAVLAIVLLRERPDSVVGVGIALAVGGACVLAWGAVRLDAAVGLTFFFLGTACWALYTVLVNKFSDRLCAVAAATLPTALGAAFLAPRAAAEWTSPGPGPWLAVAALGVFGSGVAFLLWNYGVGRVTASYAGVFTNVAPVVAVVAAAIVLHEDVAVTEGIGGAIVIVGATIASLGRAWPKLAGRRRA